MARPRLSTEAADGIRAEICAAAATLYERDGYDAVTLRAIAAAMGRSQALPYRYFKNKEHIFAALRAVWFDRLTELMEAAIKGLESPLLKLHAIARTAIAFAAVAAFRIPADVLAASAGPDRFPRTERGAAAHDGHPADGVSGSRR
ncbi:MAG: helix-turn-helix domain-containing protein [Nevskia sp.]|nr:helix-turn-helix domain-containing protein [Nevskia sp.]